MRGAYTRIIIESDSQVAANFCNSDDDNRLELRSIREIRRAFTSFSILVVRRDGNNAAHTYVINKLLVVIAGDASGSIVTQIFSVTLFVSDCTPVS
jgi:hypothetical protein